MRTPNLPCMVLAAVATLLPHSLVAQIRAPDFLDAGSRAQLMLLGTFHFSYPERDVVKSTNRTDVLAPNRQRELEELVRHLSAFAPTRIAVERRRESQPKIDSLYAAYRRGEWELPAGEEYQIGFRLARALGHERLYAVDTERADVLLEMVQRELEPREAELMATDTVWRRRFDRQRAYEDSLARTRYRTISEIFIAMNTADAVRRSHMAYHVGFFKFDGQEGGYAGADFVAGWYDRNLRIFRNLQRITRGPDERILLIIGSGHLPILRFVAQHSPEYRLVEVGPYLGGTH